jgi:hypothetical protein
VNGWKDAYESQVDVWKWLRSPYGRAWHDARYRADASTLVREETKTMLGQLFSLEEDTLLYAPPYYVSGEMCEVIDAAAATFETEPLLDTDLLSPSGFAYFARPFVMPDRYEVMTHLGGFSWWPLATQHRETNEVQERGIALTLYAAPDAVAWEKWPAGQHLPDRIPIHHTPWWYEMTFEGNEIDEAGARTGVEQWWKVLQTTLRLMQQRITVRHPLRPDRASRRRGARLGFPEREVVVVKLRREATPPGEEPLHGDANYSHRFIVSGHWRNQWYPASNVHRQIWISPYVKGPEDQPLVVRPRRVFTFNR